MMTDGFNRRGNCITCKMPRTEDGHDPCIANLPGVIYACCGHGIENGYIKFEDGRCLRFKAVEMELDAPKYELIVHPEPVPVFIPGDDYRVLTFKTGKVRTVPGDAEVLSVNGQKVTIQRRK